jgi:hypothetical protein
MSFRCLPRHGPMNMIVSTPRIDDCPQDGFLGPAPFASILGWFCVGLIGNWTIKSSRGRGVSCLQRLEARARTRNLPAGCLEAPLAAG